MYRKLECKHLQGKGMLILCITMQCTVKDRVQGLYSFYETRNPDGVALLLNIETIELEEVSNCNHEIWPWD